jgi:protocatechuate 3,4-dioxygenase beta subunit
MPDGPATGYAPVYYPGATTLSQATPTPLGPGEERAGLDFQLQRVPVARIEGVIANATGQPLQNIQITLTDLNQAAPGIGGNSTRADPDGAFRFTNVAPGQYRIAARAVVGGGGGRGGGRGMGPLRGQTGTGPDIDAVRLWASMDVTVDGRDITNVGLSLQHGVNASGRLVFQGTTLQPPADLTRMRVSLVPADPAAGRELAAPVAGRVDAAGRVSMTSITPGRYRLTVGGAPQGWMLESAVVDGQDVLDFPLDIKPGQPPGSATITFSDRGSELTGTLVDGQGRPAPGYTVILYAADPRYWAPQSRRIRATRPATDGRFSFSSTPPGDYRLVPVEDVEPGAWFDPAFLQQLDAAAVRVSIAEGEKKVQTVRITGQQ